MSWGPHLVAVHGWPGSTLTPYCQHTDYLPSPPPCSCSWIATRKRYCRRVEAKLGERASLRLLGRAWEAWLAFQDERALARDRLRSAVRRMSYLKLWHAFAAWHELAAARRAQAAQQATLEVAAVAHMQRWRLRRVFGAWAGVAAAAAVGRAALLRMAARADAAALAAAFGAWRRYVAEHRKLLAAFEIRTAARRQGEALRAAFDGWRLATDDSQGAALQLRHARTVLARLRLDQAFAAWRSWQQAQADRHARWEATVEHMQRRLALVRLGNTFAAWQQLCEQHRQQRELFYRSDRGDWSWTCTAAAAGQCAVI